MEQIFIDTVHQNGKCAILDSASVEAEGILSCTSGSILDLCISLLPQDHLHMPSVDKHKILKLNWR